VVLATLILMCLADGLLNRAAAAVPEASKQLTPQSVPSYRPTAVLALEE